MSAALQLPVIETPRLVLTLPAPSDAHRMLRYAVNNKEHLAPWESARRDEYYTLEHWSKFVASAAREFARGESLRLILLDRANQSGPVQGQCAFTNIVRGPFQAAHLGYSLDRDAEGRGLMQEALTAAIKFVFEEMNLHRLMANYMPTNERSARLLERLGFVVEGRAREYLQIAGAWQDHILTSLINQHWAVAQDT